MRTEGWDMHSFWSGTLIRCRHVVDDHYTGVQFFNMLVQMHSRMLSSWSGIVHNA